VSLNTGSSCSPCDVHLTGYIMVEQPAAHLSVLHR